MRKKFIPQDFTVKSFSAKENRAWRYFNMPWVWETNGVNSEAIADDAGTFEAQVQLPTADYENFENSPRHLNGSLMSRVSFQTRFPCNVGIGEQVSVHCKYRLELAHALWCWASNFVSVHHSARAYVTVKMAVLEDLERQDEDNITVINVDGDENIFGTFGGKMKLPDDGDLDGSGNARGGFRDRYPMQERSFTARSVPIDRGAKNIMLTVDFWLSFKLSMSGRSCGLHGGFEDSLTAMMKGELLEVEINTKVDTKPTRERRKTFDPSKGVHEFNIAIDPLLQGSILPTLYRKLSEASPLASLTLKPFNPETVEALLKSGALDFAIGALPTTLGSGIRAERVGPDPLLSVMRAGHPLLGRRRVKRAAWGSARHLELYSSSQRKSSVDKLLSSQGIQRKVALRVTQPSMIPGLLKESDLIATLPASAVKVMVAEHGLKSLDLGDRKKLDHPLDLPARALGMLWHDSTHITPRLRWLRRLVLPMIKC